MTEPDVNRKILALMAKTVANGATLAEQAAAQRKARALIARQCILILRNHLSRWRCKISELFSRRASSPLLLQGW